MSRAIWPRRSTLFSSFKGRRLSSFFKSTAPSSAIETASLWWSNQENGLFSLFPDFSTTLSILSTDLSRYFFSSLPFFRAFIVAFSIYLEPPGILRSHPALKLSTLSFIAPQSEITSPSQCHSFLSISSRRKELSLAYVPLILL